MDDQVLLGKNPPRLSHPNPRGREGLTPGNTSFAGRPGCHRQKKQGRKRPCLGVSVAGVTGYGRNVLHGPASPKPNRPAATANNTRPPDTRMPENGATGWAGFFMPHIITQTQGNWEVFCAGQRNFSEPVSGPYRPWPNLLASPDRLFQNPL